VVKTTALTTSGLLRGQEEAGVVVFRGVPYATCDRFCPPVPVAAWEGERAATVDGPIAPNCPRDWNLSWALRNTMSSPRIA
jgi:para-nitrobenzyl esterase